MEWWTSLIGVEKIFWGIAIIFSVLFVIQFALSFIGLDLDSDADMDAGHDFDHGDGGFTILSVRSIIAFFTFFGWSGVISLNAGLPVFIATGIAALSGLGAMFIVAYTMYFFIKMESSGTMLMGNAINQVGEVYLIIPEAKQGKGKVQVKVQGTLRELDAITNGETIPTGTMIRVIDIVDNKLLVVEPVAKELLANKN